MIDRTRLRNDIPGHNPMHTEMHGPNHADSGRLTVGRDITLSGEIGCCHDLLVDGTVQAELKEGVNLDISETGLFNGIADVQNAVIAGRFEGTLIVRNQLVIRPSAQISGTIEYGQIEIQSGARVIGSMTVLEVEQPAEIIANQPAATENVPYNVEPIADQNPGALEDKEMQDIIARIEGEAEQDHVQNTPLPFSRVANS